MNEIVVCSVHVFHIYSIDSRTPRTVKNYKICINVTFKKVKDIGIGLVASSV